MKFSAVHAVPLVLEYIAPFAPTATNTVPKPTPSRSFVPRGVPTFQAAPASRGTAETDGLPGPPGPPSFLALTVKEYVVPLTSAGVVLLTWRGTTWGEDADRIACACGSEVQLSVVMLLAAA